MMISDRKLSVSVSVSAEISVSVCISVSVSVSFNLSVSADISVQNWAENRNLNLLLSLIQCKKKMFFNLKKLKENIIFQTFSNCELRYQNYNLLISIISFLISLIRLSNYKTVSCLTCMYKLIYWNAIQVLILSFGFGFGFGFGMLCLSVSVSVSVQTKPKFRYFGFGSNYGFGRSLICTLHIINSITFPFTYSL